MVQRLRRRELFAFAGEVILTPEHKLSLLGQGNRRVRDKRDLERRQYEEDKEETEVEEHGAAEVRKAPSVAERIGAKRRHSPDVDLVATSGTGTATAMDATGAATATTGSIEDVVKADLVELISTSYNSSIPSSDIFCQLVKMSYGMGNKNPISGPTAFYEPRKVDVTINGNGHGRHTATPDGKWNVGIVPPGKATMWFYATSSCS